MYFGVQQIVKPSQEMINFKYRGEIATPASFCESASSILYSLLGRLADLYLAHPVVPICFTWVCIPSEVVLAVPVAAVSKPSDQPNRRIQFKWDRHDEIWPSLVHQATYQQRMRGLRRRLALRSVQMNSFLPSHAERGRLSSACSAAFPLLAFCFRIPPNEFRPTEPDGRCYVRWCQYSTGAVAVYEAGRAAAKGAILPVCPWSRARSLLASNSAAFFSFSSLSLSFCFC